MIHGDAIFYCNFLLYVCVWASVIYKYIIIIIEVCCKMKQKIWMMPNSTQHTNGNLSVIWIEQFTNLKRKNCHKYFCHKCLFLFVITNVPFVQRVNVWCLATANWQHICFANLNHIGTVSIRMLPVYCWC